MNSIFSKKTKEKTLHIIQLVFAPKYRRKICYGQKRLEIGKILRDISEWHEVFGAVDTM